MKKFKLPEFKFKKPSFKLPWGKSKAEDAPAVETAAEEIVPPKPNIDKSSAPGSPIIAINLHDFRYELTKVDIQKQMLKACGVAVFCAILAAANWMVEQGEVDNKHREIKELERQVKALEKDFNDVKSMQAKSKRLLQIISGIQKLRNGQLETTKVLNDLYTRIPDNIWLTSIEQKNWRDLKKSRVPYILFEDPAKKKRKKKRKKKKKKGEIDKSRLYEFIELKGVAAGLDASDLVAQLTQDLSQIPYFKKVFIFKTRQSQSSGRPTVKFSIYCYMPIKPVQIV